MTTTQRGYGSDHAKRRKALLEREPWCRACAKHGRQVKATVRDHIVAKAHGGAESQDNEQPLCKSCSNRKTAEEGRRGQ